MADRLDHPTEYSKAMKGLGYGHALYHPPALAQLGVGSFGYFDKEGDWNKLGEIPLVRDVQSGRPFSADVMSSMGVEQQTLGIDALVDAPVSGKLDARVEYTTKQDFAAVLLARPFLIKHHVSDEAFFSDWLKKNFTALLKQHADIDRYGLVVVFKTCSTPYCSIATFGGAMKSVTAGFSGGAYTPGANARLSASGSWHLEAKTGAWRSFGTWKPEEEDTEDGDDEEQPQDILTLVQRGVKSLFPLQTTSDNAPVDEAGGDMPEGEESDEADDFKEHVAIFISAFHARKRLMLRGPKLSEIRASDDAQSFDIDDGDGGHLTIDVSKWGE